MYKFVDTNEVSEGALLPSEALKLNGEYIENLIEGYRTLTVSGREALSPELETFDTGIRDGSTLKSKRYPARYIIVKYQLIAESNEAFREAYNKLGGILNVTDAQLIFEDEPDKYFVGTLSRIGEVEPGANAVIGEFEFICADPFKYSVEEYEVEPDLDSGSIFVDYKGTYKSFPTLRAEFFNEDEISADGETATELTGSGDCGYVAFFNESEKIIQMGDPEEKDLDEDAFAKSQTMINQDYNKSNSWGSAAQSIWTMNNGLPTSSAFTQSGSLKTAVASYTTPSMPSYTTEFIYNLSSYADKPTFFYTLSARSYERTSDSVKVDLIVKVRLGNASSFFGLGYDISAEWNIRPAQGSLVGYDMPLKNKYTVWKGNGWHTITKTIKVSGLKASDTSIPTVTFRTYQPSGTGKAGTIGWQTLSPIKISAYATAQPASYYITPASYGSGSTSWHGASITRTLPADTAGVVGATDFALTYAQKMCIGSGATNQCGCFSVSLVSGSGSNRKVVAGLEVNKNSSGKYARLLFFINGSLVETVNNIDISYNNATFTPSKTSTITKSGQTVTFNICGIKKTYRNADIANVAVNQVTFIFSQLKTITPLAYNGLSWVKFVKNNCQMWKDIPNKFSANDVVEADCKSGEIYLNGISTPALGALGNDWEDFYLTPGLNQIGFSYSEWVSSDYAPKFKLKYREVFL